MTSRYDPHARTRRRRRRLRSDTTFAARLHEVKRERSCRAGDPGSLAIRACGDYVIVVNLVHHVATRSVSGYECAFYLDGRWVAAGSVRGLRSIDRIANHPLTYDEVVRTAIVSAVSNGVLDEARLARDAGGDYAIRRWRSAGTRKQRSRRSP